MPYLLIIFVNKNGRGGHQQRTKRHDFVNTITELKLLDNSIPKDIPIVVDNRHALLLVLNYISDRSVFFHEEYVAPYGQSAKVCAINSLYLGRPRQSIEVCGSLRDLNVLVMNGELSILATILNGTLK